MLMVPVPLFSRKQRKQGFNHSERIARAMLVAMRSTNPDAGLTLALSALERHRATDPQANLTPRQRRHNVRGAFAVRQPGRIAGRDVLLVDDIYTTGATVRAASLALLRGGAASVWVLTMARAQREGVALWDMPAEVSVEVSVEVSSIAEATVVGHPQPTVSGQPWESHV
jgi:ComF family protein